ncbi:peptidoglycan-binding LysM [Deinococcus phoenicis]|uniref:Peptidoglycan-binding LysM n=1 Tax=Deinococcus phoenicis TaxID=1476583 RepID=A0A016QMW1_9DEIO|nr:LysM peptidoglycan-binding domain-containing protein [Deinococcus phoenicis]EYB67336.1 peptidoglycan-binding LysM [Deinococcus phoenicis]
MLHRAALLILLSPLLLGPGALAASGTVKVQQGDTLYGIARRSGVSVSQLKALNGLKTNTIRPGQTLRVSGKAAVPASAAPPPRRAAVSSAFSTYTVRAGDTLGGIAGRAGVSVAALRAANGLSGSLIKPGQRLRVPPRGTTTAPRSAPPPRPTTEVRVIHGYVRVQPHETLAALARTYRTTADHLAKLNGLSRAGRQLYPGQRVLVPRRIPVPIPPRPVRPPLSVRQLRALDVPVQVLRVDLRWRDVLVAPVLPRAGLGVGVGARVSSLVRTSGARAVVNGSYFHPRSYVPAGDLVMQGRLLAWGRIPAALAITPDNRAAIMPSTTPLLGRPLDVSWRGMETVIATGPRILNGGAVVRQYASAFRDPALFGRAARSAVGLGSNRDLVFVTTHAKLTTTEMGKVMARLGLRDALLLDGGSSAGLAWNGQPVLDSVRQVAYGIGVFTGYTGRRYAR